MLKFYSQKVCLSPSMNKYQTPISDLNKEFAFQLEYKNYYDMRTVNVLNSLSHLIQGWNSQLLVRIANREDPDQTASLEAV